MSNYVDLKGNLYSDLSSNMIMNLSDGNILIKLTSVIIPNTFLLQEDGSSFFLQEDGSSKIVLES